MKRAVLLLLLLAACTPRAAGGGFQDAGRQPVPGAQDEDDVVELETTLVEVPVVVAEPGGRYVLDLKQGDFSISENGVKQNVDFFASVDEPFNVALMIDTSGSTREKLDKIKAAASAFIDQLRPKDRVSVIAFEDEVKVLTPLTTDREQARQALAGLDSGQYTQVYEAMHEAAEDVLGYVEGRKAAILFSDGLDTASALSTFESSLGEVAHRQIIVYPIRYNTRPDVEAQLELMPEEDGTRPRRVAKYIERRDKVRSSLDDAYRVADSYLTELAGRSGGVLYRADTLADLPAAFSQIAEELRHQYLLGYYPAKDDLADSERHIAVTVSRPDVVVRSRNVYRRPKK
jgi:VWFA-related protein